MTKSAAVRRIETPSLRDATQSLPLHAVPRPAGAELFLGPARVEAVDGSTVFIATPTGTVEAEMALAFPYQAVIGDVVLAVGHGGSARHYVIGILHGSGRVSFEMPGDLDLRARGKLRLAADEGVEIDAPRVAIETGSLRVLAGAVVQQFQSLRQRVLDLVSNHVGESHTVVEGAQTTQARSSTLLTQEKVSINGREIHLG